MLDRLRASTQTFFGRAVMALVMGLIILSFVIWGVGDIFGGVGSNTIARVGSTEITVPEYRTAYQNQLQRVQRQARRAITPQEAKAYGLDRQVLSRLVADAALDEKAAQLGLAVSDQTIAKAIMSDETFKGPSGSFDKQRFEELLRDNGLNEKIYVHDQRDADLREQITGALTSGIELPQIMAEAIHKFQSETRDADYFVLPQSAAGEVAPPSEEALQSYFSSHASQYRTEEYRKLNVLTITPDLLAKKELPSITDEAAQRLYDEVKDKRFMKPEQRDIEQLILPEGKSAEAARQKLTNGLSFDDLVKEQNLTPKDVDLGLITRDKLIDKAVAEAAFTLPEGEVSQPIKAEFGTVLVRVTKIVPGEVKPFAEVKDEIKQELALKQAKAKLEALHDQIEDQRNAGKTLDEAAKAAGLEPHIFESVNAGGQDDKGAPVEGLIDLPVLLKAAFASDVGVDNETLRIKDGGYQWFEVLHIDKAKQKTFAEVKDQVKDAFTNEEQTKNLQKKAVELVEKINSGETLVSVAQSLGDVPVQHAKDVTRAGGSLPENIASQVFNVGVNGAGSTRDQSGGRIIFEVMASNVPPVDEKAPDFVALISQVKDGLKEDIVEQYISKLQKDFGLKFNAQAFAAANSN